MSDELWFRSRAMTFQPITDPAQAVVIAALKAMVDRALAERDEHAAAEAHEALVEAEHRKRVAETVRRCSQ